MEAGRQGFAHHRPTHTFSVTWTSCPKLPPPQPHPAPLPGQRQLAARVILPGAKPRPVRKAHEGVAPSSTTGHGRSPSIRLTNVHLTHIHTTPHSTRTRTQQDHEPAAAERREPWRLVPLAPGRGNHGSRSKGMEKDDHPQQGNGVCAPSCLLEQGVDTPLAKATRAAFVRRVHAATGRLEWGNHHPTLGRAAAHSPRAGAVCAAPRPIYALGGGTARRPSFLPSVRNDRTRGRNARQWGRRRRRSTTAAWKSRGHGWGAAAARSGPRPRQTHPARPAKNSSSLSFVPSSSSSSCPSCTKDSGWARGWNGEATCAAASDTGPTSAKQFPPASSTTVSSCKP